MKGEMSKVLWFSTAILLCSALAAEALTCINCKNYDLNPSKCVGKKPSETCIAKPGQPCRIVKYFEDGKMKNVLLQGCLEPNKPCNGKATIPPGRTFQSICCDDRDLCNTP